MPYIFLSVTVFFLIFFRYFSADYFLRSDISGLEDTLKIIWAYGTTDPTGTDILAANYHGIQNRGTQNFIPLQAIPTAQLAPVVGETLFTFDLVNSNFAVPAMDTYYSCRMLAFPTLTSKHHIVKMEPIITAGNTLNVHHLVLYTCSQQTLQNPSLLGTTRQCYVNLPTDFQTCQSPYMAWAVGGQSFALPKEAGFSLGSTGDPKYVMLEIHYDNPALSTTIMDSSGLKMSYTPNLRTHDAAMMQVGHTVSGFNHLIPPNATAFNSYGECSQNCLESSLTAASRTSFTVFATILHSHLLGRAIALKHLTGGTEHKPIAVDNTYDFNFQENRYLPDYRVVQSGDSLQVVCTYNSVGKTGFAWGGLGTVNEMCMAFVFYYPQLPVALCDTAPQIDLLLSHLGYNINDLTFPSSNLAYSSLSDVTINSGAESGMTVIQSLNSKSWDNVNGNALSEAMKVATRRQSCTRNRVSPAGATTNVEAPVITTPYVPSQLTCQPVTSPTLSSAVQSCTVNNAGVGTTALSPYVGIYISLLALISFIFLA